MYDVDFTPEALSNLSDLNKTNAQRILKKIRWLAENFEDTTPSSLTGQWQGLFKLRVGDYRVLYTYKRTDQKMITVHLIGHRREIYKKRL